MTSRALRISLLLLLLLTAWPGGAALAAEKKDAGIAIDFRDVELTDLIQTISEMTGKNFIYDDTVKGKVSIISPDRMSPDEAYEAFLSVLSVKGFTIVPSGRTNKIVPIRLAKESNLPSGVRVPSGEQYVTQLIRMKYVDANDLANSVLRELVPKTSHVAAYGPSNTLIITDNAANIERLVQIIRQLDVPTTLEQIEIVPLQYAGAEEMAEIITQLLSRSGSFSVQTRGKKAATPNDVETTRVIPYPRTNSLIVIAAQGELQTIRSLVARLDQSPPDDRSYINVYYLENADATTLAATLNEILTGISQKAREDRTAQKTQQPVTLKQVTITADKPTNALIINAKPEEYEIIKGIVKKLDIKRKQVFVEALIMELSLDATKNLGLSLVGAGTTDDGLIIGGSNINKGSVNNTDFLPNTDLNDLPTVLGKAVNGLMTGGFFNPTTVELPDGTSVTVPALSVLLDLSQTDGDINILAAPRLLTSDNEEAEIVIGSNIPIITERLTDTGASTTGLAQSVSIERQDAALTLRFTPQVTEGDEVRLNIYQEVTDVASTSVGDVDQVGPTLTKRLLRNTVIAENGRTIALGGLISTNFQDTITKVPLLGDIPILGWLFKRKDVTERKTNLLVFITPHIIRSAEDLERLTNKSREAMERYRTRKIDFDQPIRSIEKNVSGDGAAEAGEGN